MRTFLSLLCLMLPALASSQKVYEYSRLRLGVEAGFENFFGSNVKPPAIRESQSYYRYRYNDYYYDCGYLYNEPVFTRFYFGIKPEYSINHRLAVSAGLRFSYGESSLTSDRDYFLWKINETETTTNYLSITSIRQNVHCIGIPFEWKFFTYGRDVFVRHYFKTGVVLNFAFAQDVLVHFSNNEMAKYLPEIKKQFEAPNSFYGHLILATGLKIGRMKNPFGSVEIQVPIHFTEKTNLSSLFKADVPVGIGIQTTFYLPFGKEK